MEAQKAQLTTRAQKAQPTLNVQMALAAMRAMKALSIRIMCTMLPSLRKSLARMRKLKTLLERAATPSLQTRMRRQWLMRCGKNTHPVKLALLFLLLSMKGSKPTRCVGRTTMQSRRKRVTKTSSSKRTLKVLHKSGAIRKMRSFQLLLFGTMVSPMKRMLLPLLPHLLRRARMGPPHKIGNRPSALMSRSP